MPQFKLIEIIGVLVALTVLLGVAFGAYKYIATSNFEAGKAEERATWQARESKELAAANAQILLMEDTARMLERKASAAVTQANDARRKADDLAKAQIKPVASTVAAGLASLCPGGSAAGEGAGERPASATAADPERSPGIDRADILAKLGERLSSEAARADSYARKLIEAVALLKLDRDTCNAP